MSAVYNEPGIRLTRGRAGKRPAVLALQTDLRRLGYLRGGIDGDFGPATELAVRAAQTDLLTNDGRGPDGSAPIVMTSFNHGRVRDVDGTVDSDFAQCLEDLINDDRVTKLPRSEDPGRDNQRAVDALRAIDTKTVPLPFLLAVLRQETGLRHFQVPTDSNWDDYIVVGLDRNDGRHPARITSRGYGIGQFTLFHHPPTSDEVAALMLDPVKNVEHAIRALREKFDRFILGPTAKMTADDRAAEIGRDALRACRYDPADARFQRACRQCAAAASRTTLAIDTPLFPGSNDRWHPTQYHPEKRCDDLPDRKAFGCDWPYAVRRYNGSGADSYHYQAEVLQRFMKDPVLIQLLGAGC
jgi:hypothetical protein